MGARAWNVATPEELNTALGEARGESRSCVIVAETEPHRYGPASGVWWDVAAAEVSASPETQRARKDYLAAWSKLQRFHS